MWLKTCSCSFAGPLRGTRFFAAAGVPFHTRVAFFRNASQACFVNTIVDPAVQGNKSTRRTWRVNFACKARNETSISAVNQMLNSAANVALPMEIVVL